MKIALKNISITFWIATAIACVALGIMIIAFKDTDHLLVLHFDAVRGIDRFGTREEAIGITVFGLAMNIINIGLVKVLYDRDRLLAWFIAAVNIVVVSIVLLATIIIVINN